jgi:GNAT superfamily N-acetyltransferase
MPAAGDGAGSFAARLGRRWQAIDPLLPSPEIPAQSCGAELMVEGPDGQPAATGTCEHWVGVPESLELAWGATRRFLLTPRIAGPDVAAALDGLLSLWREHLARLPCTASADTAAVVTWPSRDIEGVLTLLDHGLTPLNVIAARTARGHRAEQAALPDPQPGLQLRRAGAADIDTVARLGLEVVRFDAHFGGVTERPGTADALRREAAEALGRQDPWTWLAERDGKPIGLLSAQRPESAAWIASMVRAAPVAYLELMAVLPGQRGGGIGAALTRELHREAEAAGVAAVLLHYSLLNPLSVPFWSQQGYRPLWTSWQAWPARAIR